MPDNDKTHDELTPPDAESPLEDEDSVDFSDRVVAFLILILPFSWSIDKAQELLLDLVTPFVSHMAGTLWG